VRRLPDQQRSALLMREMDGMSYAELAEALGVSLQAVKSLLVRARIGLVEAVEARDTACSEIRLDLTDAFDRGVRASGLARRHLRDCEACVEYKAQLRAVHQGLAILGPGSTGPLAAALKLIGLGGAGSAGAASASGGAAAGGGALAAAGTATKVAAVVCAAAITAGGAAEVREQIVKPNAPPSSDRMTAKAPAATAVRSLSATRAIAAAAVGAVPVAAERKAAKADAASPVATTAGRHRSAATFQADPDGGIADPVTLAPPKVDDSTGGASAPSEEDGFGVGVDGMTPRPEPTTAGSSPPQTAAPVTSSPSGETGGGHATPPDAVEGGGESSSVEPAASSIPPG
jgi:hypothetical protein